MNTTPLRGGHPPGGPAVPPPPASPEPAGARVPGSPTPGTSQSVSFIHTYMIPRKLLYLMPVVLSLWTKLCTHNYGYNLPSADYDMNALFFNINYITTLCL